MAINNCITAVRNLIPKDNFAKCNCTCATDVRRINNTISSLGSYFAEKSKLNEYATTHALDKIKQKLLFLESKVPQAVTSCNCNCPVQIPMLELAISKLKNDIQMHENDFKIFNNRFIGINDELLLLKESIESFGNTLVESLDTRYKSNSCFNEYNQISEKVNNNCAKHISLHTNVI